MFHLKILQHFLHALHEKPCFLSPNDDQDGLSKKIALEYDLSCIISKDDISFSRKYDLIL